MAGPVLAVIGWAIVLGLTVLVCVVLYMIGFVAPRRALQAQRGVGRALFRSEDKTGEKAPDAVERWVRKPFETSRKATDKSAEAGRKSRFKLPF